MLNAMPDTNVNGAQEIAIRGSGRPKAYILKDGTKVSGTTTIVNRFKDSGGLLQWAFQQGKLGLGSLYEKSDEAMDIGSISHACIQADIHNDLRPMIPEDKTERVLSALAAYGEWFDGSRMKIVSTEIPLVSEIYRYGGTIDAVAKDGKGRLCLLDWKTSNAVYPDYAMQLAAYRQLWNENNPDDQITDGGYHLCRFAKEHGDFEHRFWPDLTEAFEEFALLVRAYELDKKLKQRIK